MRVWRLFTLAGCCLATLDAQTPPQTPPPVFRAATSLVPLDVRVVDRAGKPVTSLTAADFTILENGVPQALKHFSTQALAAQPVTPDLERPRTIADPAPLGSQTRRIFLIVLGRGRLQPPGGGVDGVLHLVRDRLLPQDLVAVIAWNRATSFTVDHASALAVLDRFKTQHERIETDLSEWCAGLRAMFNGCTETPAYIQTRIDEVFGGPSRTLASTPIANAARVDDDQRRMMDRMLRDRSTEALPPEHPFLREIESPATNLDVPLDEMAGINAQSMQDLSKVYTGIQYMRYLDGEKHLVFVSPGGVFLPRADDDHSLAATAADARVTLDILHTGGVSAAGGFDWRIPTSKTAAEETGGSFASLVTAKAFVDRLDAATRFQYVLGYYPSNPALDGKFRRIAVRVNRPGLTVQYRRGYFSRRDPAPLDRARIQPYTRVTAAATQAQLVRDLTVTVSASNTTAADKSRTVAVAITLLPNRLVFTEKDGRQTGRLDVAIFCADSRQGLIGQSWNTIDLNMTPEVFAQLKATGFALNGTVAVPSLARHVKVVVYDAGSDLVGSATATVK